MAISDLLHYVYLVIVARSFNGLAASFTMVASLVGAVETSVPDEVISVPGKKGRNVTVHVYLNEAAKRAKVERRPCVTYITLHGGGFILKRHGRDAGFINHLLQSTVLESIPLIILDSDYPHAPEYPFPAPIEDITSLVAYVQAHPDIYDQTKLLIGGFSAGANIALGASVFMGEEAIRAGQPHPLQGVVAFYPPVNLVSRRLNPEISRPAHPVPGSILSNSMSSFFDACYFCSCPNPDEETRKPYASPILADVGTFPAKILLVTCEYDGLRVSSEKFREKLRTEGGGKIDVRGRLVEGVAHGWDCMIRKEGVPGWKERVEMYDEVAKLVHDVAAN